MTTSQRIDNDKYNHKLFFIASYFSPSFLINDQCNNVRYETGVKICFIDI